MKKIFRKRVKTDSISQFDIKNVENDQTSYHLRKLGEEGTKEITEYRFRKDYKQLHGFDKSRRSDFPYWFSHWCAFQMQALIIGAWKFKYLFHDIEKPWMKLFKPYKAVQKYHRTHASHHLDYGLIHDWDKVDWEALVIDWECSRFTKTEAQRDAYETLEIEISGKWADWKDEIYPRVKQVLDFYNL